MKIIVEKCTSLIDFVARYLTVIAEFESSFHNALDNSFATMLSSPAISRPHPLFNAARVPRRARLRRREHGRPTAPPFQLRASHFGCDHASLVQLVINRTRFSARLEATHGTATP